MRHPTKPRWRNWQTRNVEVVVGETPCWFNSSPGHFILWPLARQTRLYHAANFTHSGITLAVLRLGGYL